MTSVAIIGFNDKDRELYRRTIISRRYQIMYVTPICEPAKILIGHSHMRYQPDIAIIENCSLNSMQAIANGFNIAKLLKNSFPQIEIIYVGADSDQIAEATENGITRFLDKPLYVNSLIEEIDKIAIYKNYGYKIEGQPEPKRGRPEKPELERKTRITFSITKKVVDEFIELCEFNKEDNNRLVEGLLVKYIEDQKKASINAKKIFENLKQSSNCQKSQSKTILVTDDMPETTKVIANMVEKLGYQSLKAYNGKECLLLAKEHLPDLILLDIGMDKMDGWEVARKIKNDHALKKIPIVIITGQSPIGNEVGNNLHLVNNYLVKPISSFMLKEVIDEVFHES